MTIIENYLGDINYLTPSTLDRDGRPTVFLVHGAGGYADAWASILEKFTSVVPIAIDIPGHGKSGGQLPTTALEGAEILEAFRRDLEVDSVYVVGHSLGGAIAQHYAHRHPEHCKGAILSNTSSYFGSDILPPGRKEQLAKFENDWPSAIEFFSAGQVSPRASARALAAARDMVGKRRHEVMSHDVTVVGSFDSRDWVGSITPPCLILTAYEDMLTPFDWSRDLYDRIEHSQLAVVSPGGHSPFLEHPLRYVAAIESFIAEVEAGGSG